MMRRAGQCARAADWYGTSMMVYLGAKGRERNTDHACLISCQYDCTKSSYNDLNFVQKHSDHPLLMNRPRVSPKSSHIPPAMTNDLLRGRQPGQRYSLYRAASLLDALPDEMEGMEISVFKRAVERYFPQDVT